MMAPALVASSGVFKTNFLQMKDTYPQYHPCWWFDNYLPEPYRRQAIRNCKHKKIISKSGSLHQAIKENFVWILTPKGQGHKYWESIYNRSEAGEFNTPIP